jgi:hypothetical protein
VYDPKNRNVILQITRAKVPPVIGQDECDAPASATQKREGKFTFEATRNSAHLQGEPPILRKLLILRCLRFLLFKYFPS